MAVRQEQDRILVAHKGASVEILHYGATVVSWKCPEERLFVSSKAALDGSKPVRGGIPVVFPCFGAPTHPEHARLSQHGFARSQTWTYDGVVKQDTSGVSVRLTLDPTASIKATYDGAFHLAYVVTLGEDQLSTELHVTNTATGPGTGTLAFQALFHNYIRAPAKDVLVSPLQNTQYYDKTEGTEEGRNTAKTETRAGVDVRQYTDSVYQDAPGEYEVRWTGGGVRIATEGLKDVVVWNPQEGAGSKIGDMEPGGWEKYVCVEPGHVRGFVQIEAGKTWVGRQTMSLLI